MRWAVVAVSLAIGPAAFAQAPADPVEQLRACSQLQGAERLACLDRLSHEIAPPPRPDAPPAAPASGDWIISETTSPVDYTPMVVATARSHDTADTATLALAIRCHGGRIEVSLATPALAGKADAYTVSFSVNDGQPRQASATMSPSRTGLILTGNVMAVLASWPDEGMLAVRVLRFHDTEGTGSFALNGLKRVRSRMPPACRWPESMGPAGTGPAGMGPGRS